jgi:membrane protein
MLKKIKNNIQLVLNGIIRSSQKIILPGFEGLSLYIVVVFFLRGLKRGSITTRASSVAFNFFLAFIPTIIFLFSLIPYIPIDNFHEQLFIIIKSLLPYDTYLATKTTIEDIIETPRGNVLSLGIGLALFFATNGVSSMIDAFNASYLVYHKRTFISEKIVSLVLVFILSFLVLFSTSFIILSSVFLDNIESILNINHSYTVVLLQLVNWIVLLFLLFFGFSFIYYYAPSKKSDFKFFSAGSTLATLLSILTSILFAFYVNNFGQYNKFYGSLGTLIVGLLWIYFNSFSLLLGFELNASIKIAHKRKVLFQDE